MQKVLSMHPVMCGFGGHLPNSGKLGEVFQNRNDGAGVFVLIGIGLMNHTKYYIADGNFQAMFKRPLSLIAAVLAVVLIVYEVVQIGSGNLYQEALNDMDGTTLVELGILALLGIFTLRHQTDLHAVSFTLVVGLSFIFIYEAIYKWSFFLAPFPFGKPMPPAEIREFIIQAGIALSILTGFAVRDFTVRKWTLVWLGIFMVLWVFWLLVGFPQITGAKLYFDPVIPINFTHEMTYVLNRSTKFFMYLAYLTLFPPLRKPSYTTRV